MVEELSLHPYPSRSHSLFTDQLEHHIEASAVILVFLSAGYFKSRNCLREIRAAIEQKKPLLLVHESDPAKGGAPLEALKSTCPADIRVAVFSHQVPTC